MSPSSAPPSDAAPRTCSSCGARVDGRFCAQCGAPATPGACVNCGTSLSPAARFCHRCGAAAQSAGAGSRGRETTGWIIAASAILVALTLVIWTQGRSGLTVPDMGNAGNVGAPGAVAPLSGRAPDISNMTPREQFDRLYLRITDAADRGDTTTVVQFAPMGLGAYAQLDAVNTDARYHAAMIHLMIGDFGSAGALADTMLAQAPGHLLGYVLRGEISDRQNDTAALHQAYRDFLDHDVAELRAGRLEYAEHRPVLDDFRIRARATLGR